MTDLFTKQMEVAVHKETGTEILIENTEWYKGELHYNCLVPQKNDKGEWSFCNATYSESELSLNSCNAQDENVKL